MRVKIIPTAEKKRITLVSICFFLVNVYSYTHRPFEEAEGNVKPTWFIDPPASWKHYLYALI